MFKIFVLVAFAVVVNGFFPIEFIESQNNLIVETTGGQVQGEVLSGGLFSNYYSWKGIPYAEPPIGNLRFRAPLPHVGWEGILDGTQHRFNCPSSSLLSTNTNEDCLFLNVYSPNLIGKRPVMVWIHGGGFSGGSGDSWVYGPDHLVGEDVVVVTINYRLGALGFLSTGDANSPGNYGMKDCVLALKWIQNNILAFGGDPENVTIFGESAGGAAVHYLILSPSAKGLFHKGISQSGSALNPWAFHPNPREPALQLGRALGITTTSNEELIEALRNVDANAIVSATPGSLGLPIIRGTTPIGFVPSRDPANTIDEEQFLPADPIDIVRSANFNQVPYISGYTDAESLIMIRELLLDSSVFPTINANPELLVPAEWGIPLGSANAQSISKKIRDFYWNGTDLADDLRLEWTTYLTDIMFATGIDLQNQMHSVRQGFPIYYYKFSFVGSLNLIKTLAFLNDFPGAVHADDIFYLFSVTRVPPPLLPTNEAINTRRRMVRMWANFAKVGNPTPSTDLIVITNRWTPIMGAQEFMDINTQLEPGRFPLRERMQFWNDLRAQYAPRWRA